MTRRRKQVARRSHRAARLAGSLPRSRWEFLAWMCERWDRWVRAVLLAVVVWALLSRAGGHVVGVMLSYLP
jgi:hypothetical protein